MPGLAVAAATIPRHGTSSLVLSSSLLREMSDVNTLNRAISAPEKRYTRVSFIAAEKTSAVSKINENRLDEVTVKDIKLLFDIIDPDSGGLLTFEDFKCFLKEVLEPPCTDAEVETIYDMTEKDESGLVEPEEIHKALTSEPVRQHLGMLYRENQVKRKFDETLGKTNMVDRELLCDRLDWRVNRDDAFRTLPFSLCYILIFIGLVTTHLQIWTRQQVERGLEAWMAGYGKDLAGPYLHHAVANLDSMGSWLTASGIAAVLGECEATSNGNHFCTVATRNVLIGDVQIYQSRKDGSTRSEWLLGGSEQVKLQLAAQPHSFQGASEARLQHLWKTQWVDEETDEVKLIFSTYNRRARMFAVTQVVVAFDEYGFVVPTVVASAAVVDPYPSKAIYIFDILYCIFLAGPSYVELKDLVSSVRILGCGEGLKSYWSFWNVIDWISILCGAINIVVWGMCCTAMQASSIQSLLEEDVTKGTLAPNVMKLSPDTVETVKEDLHLIIRQFFVLHFVMAVNTITILLKFFKAFQANPRLQLVTSTLIKAANDIIHWAIVFAAIFVGFALCGNILFGGDLVQFSSFTNSINTAFAALMGDFGWYTDYWASDLGLGSGMSPVLLALWFWVFMVLVMLILLNMLLAIILEHYAELVIQVRAQDVPSVAKQSWRYVKEVRKSKDFVPMTSLLQMLTDGDTPAHPEKDVTTESLARAFEMSDTQAQFLMEWLEKEAVKRQQMAQGADDVLNLRLEAIEGFAEAVSQQLGVVSLNSSICVAKLGELRGRVKAHSNEGKPVPAGIACSSPNSAAAVVEQMSLENARQREVTQDVVQMVSELRYRAATRGMIPKMASTDRGAGHRALSPYKGRFG